MIFIFLLFFSPLLLFFFVYCCDEMHKENPVLEPCKEKLLYMMDVVGFYWEHPWHSCHCPDSAPLTFDGFGVDNRLFWFLWTSYKKFKMVGECLMYLNLNIMKMCITRSVQSVTKCSTIAVKCYQFITNISLPVWENVLYLYCWECSQWGVGGDVLGTMHCF